MYKSWTCRDHLNVDHLPQQVEIFQKTVNLEILQENLPDSIAVYGDSFLIDVFANAKVNATTGCILLLCSYSIALFILI